MMLKDKLDEVQDYIVENPGVLESAEVSRATVAVKSENKQRKEENESLGHHCTLLRAVCNRASGVHSQ
eukprot:6049774-Amphidinium_carterae.1